MFVLFFSWFKKIKTNFKRKSLKPPKMWKNYVFPLVYFYPSDRPRKSFQKLKLYSKSNDIKRNAWKIQMTLVKQLKIRKTFFPQASQRFWISLWIFEKPTAQNLHVHSAKIHSPNKNERRKMRAYHIYKEALESKLLEKEYKKAARAFCFVISDSFL